jgi:acetyl-CoA acetyltransferase
LAVADQKFEESAIVSGLGLSQMGRRTGRTAIDLTFEAVQAAIADAGLERTDVDGICSLGETPIPDVQDLLRLQLGWNGGGMHFGGVLSAVIDAVLAVNAGLARHVLIYRTVAAANMGTGAGARNEAASAAARNVRLRGATQWTTPFHVYGTMPYHAMMLRRHMHLYGTTKEQLGAIAITERYHAGFNERAAYRDPMSMEDYLSARMICEPLCLFDCDAPIDGSVAIIISAADYAPDSPNPAVRFNAVGGAIHDRGYTWDQRSDFPRMMMFEAAEQMWNRTDLRQSDMNFAELYDGFTFITLSWIEALGFAPLGEGGPFVEGGERIRLGGQLPLNTYGGQLSAGRMHGSWLFHEACLQLRGQAGERQVPDAQVAVAAGGSGPFAGCMVLTR